MAKATTLSWGKTLFYWGDGATPTELFTAVCGLTKMDLQVDKEINKFAVPDCEDQGAPVWNDAVVASLEWSGSIGGRLAKESFSRLQELMLSTDTANIKLRLVGFGSGATPDLVLSGAAHFTVSLTNETGGLAEFEATLTGSGELVATSVAALP